MVEFRLPSLGSDMDQGKLVEWRVKPGDAVRKGQVIAVVDTVKAAIDVECWHDGVVDALLIEPGTTVPVGTVMAMLRAPGESAETAEPPRAASAAAARAPSATSGVAVPAAAPEQAAARAPVAAAPTPPVSPPAVASARAADGTRQRISPAARRRAQALGIDLAAVAGSGADGAVTLEDVEAAAGQTPTTAPPAKAAKPAEPASTATPATPAGRAQAMRQVIAAAMARSKREIPHYYLSEDIPFAQAADWLAERNRTLPVTQRLLPAALLLKAVAGALKRYPEFNGTWQDGAFVAGSGIHLGVAISLRAGGLVAPALHDVDQHDIDSLTRALLDLVKRTRAGALRSSELSDATLTVTNLGEQGVASVLGIIYPPQVALVGFGRIALRPWAGEDGGVRALPVVNASLAADHRASDGHRGARLLAEIREQLQAPEALDAAH